MSVPRLQIPMPLPHHYQVRGKYSQFSRKARVRFGASCSSQTHFWGQPIDVLQIKRKFQATYHCPDQPENGSNYFKITVVQNMFKLKYEDPGLTGGWILFSSSLLLDNDLFHEGTKTDYSWLWWVKTMPFRETFTIHGSGCVPAPFQILTVAPAFKGGPGTEVNPWRRGRKSYARACHVMFTCCSTPSSFVNFISSSFEDISAHEFWPENRTRNFRSNRQDIQYYKNWTGWVV